MKTQNLAAHLPDSDDAAVARRRLAERLIEASAYDEQLPAACRDGDLELARLLLSAGADVNARDKSGATPLHRAAEEGRTDVVRLLPEAGADSEVADAGAVLLRMWRRSMVLRQLSTCCMRTATRHLEDSPLLLFCPRSRPRRARGVFCGSELAFALLCGLKSCCPCGSIGRHE